MQSGGELRAPAIELVETAKALGKLDELDETRGRDQARKRVRPRCNERGKDRIGGIDPDRPRRRYRGREGAGLDQDTARQESDRSAGMDALA